MTPFLRKNLEQAVKELLEECDFPSEIDLEVKENGLLLTVNNFEFKYKNPLYTEKVLTGYDSKKIKTMKLNFQELIKTNDKGNKLLGVAKKNYLKINIKIYIKDKLVQMAASQVLEENYDRIINRLLNEKYGKININKYVFDNFIFHLPVDVTYMGLFYFTLKNCNIEHYFKVDYELKYCRLYIPKNVIIDQNTKMNLEKCKQKLTEFMKTPGASEDLRRIIFTIREEFSKQIEEKNILNLIVSPC